MSSVREDLKEFTDRIRKEVEITAKPEETWTVVDEPRIWMHLANSRDPYSPQSQMIDTSNCDDIPKVMESLRSRSQKSIREYEEYAKALLEKCGDE